MPKYSGRGEGRGRGRGKGHGKGHHSAPQSEISFGKVTDAGAGEPAEGADVAGSVCLVKRAARPPALRRVALTLTSIKPSLDSQTRDGVSAQFYSYLHYAYDAVEDHYLVARSSNELPGMTNISFPYAVAPDSYVAFICIACYVAHIC
jgi:hypothetical protein